jgi:ATP-dependent DNA helicase RecG
MAIKNQDYLNNLIRELISLPSETEWVEFKHNNNDPQMIGEYISALGNAATLWGRPKAYLIWGIDDDTHKVVGTTFDYRNSKKGAEELEAWLSRMINPRIDFRFYETEIDNKRVTLLEIPCAEKQPIKFSGEEHIRIGTNKKKLKDYPDKERALWRAFDTTPFELRNVKDNLSIDDVLQLLNPSGYYDKIGFAFPESKNKVLDDFINEKFIRRNDAGSYDITNLGALLISKDLNSFEGLARKSIRVIWYKDNNRLDTVREKVFSEGYAVSYDKIVEYVLTIIPQEEIIEGSIRKTKLGYPEIAIRELIANLMIHQAIEQKGTSPMIELFKDRMEFSNAGSPLVPIERFVDTVPISRNENLAGFMHKCGICEERGSGFDKIIYATSKNSMPAPKIENQSDKFTKVTLYLKAPFDLISKEDRIRTCYMQACFVYVNGESITNNVVRELFGISDKDKYKASRIIKDTVEANLIKPVDENTAPRYMKYIPFWA